MALAPTISVTADTTAVAINLATASGHADFIPADFGTGDQWVVNVTLAPPSGGQDVSLAPSAVTAHTAYKVLAGTVQVWEDIVIGKDDGLYLYAGAAQACPVSVQKVRKRN